MPFRIFTLPFDEVTEGFPDEIITQFCLNKKVLSYTPHFFQKEGKAYWSIALEYEIVVKGKDNKLRQLDEEQQLLFNRLREWRSEQAKKEGLPAYLMATNAQLIQMVQLKCRTLESFKPIKGFGLKRMEKYGKPLLRIIIHFYEEKQNKKAAVKQKIDSLPFD